MADEWEWDGGDEVHFSGFVFRHILIGERTESGFLQYL